MALSGPHRPPREGPARALVVLLHGYGADGNDLIALADVMAPALPHAAFVSPHAPGQMPMGGRQWFPLTTISAEEVRTGVATAAPALHEGLDGALAQHGLTDEALALVGFSQGAMMALHVGLSRQTAIAGIVGFSGALADPGAITKPAPTLLVHGSADQVIPPGATMAAAHALAEAKVPVEWHIREGLGHGIDEAGLSMAAAHLARVLGP